MCMQVRYEERGAREEEWLSLAKCRFAWQGDLPPGSQHNPTFVPGLTPSGHEAVDQKVPHKTLLLGWLLGGISGHVFASFWPTSVRPHYIHVDTGRGMGFFSQRLLYQAMLFPFTFFLIML